MSANNVSQKIGNFMTMDRIGKNKNILLRTLRVLFGEPAASTIAFAQVL